MQKMAPCSSKQPALLIGMMEISRVPWDATNQEGAHIVKFSTLLIVLFVTASCASSGGLQTTGPGTLEVTRFAVLHEGPEVAAILVHPSGKRSLGEEWLTLAIEITAIRGSGPIIVRRDDITVRTPSGRRLKPVSQNEFRSNYPRLQIPVERTLANLPLLDRYKLSRDVPCNRWFFAPPPGTITFDEIPLSSSQICSGPLIFKVPGGVQPGRWRLIIDLQESRADIPFNLELDE
jgi:hypothetical protein